MNFSEYIENRSREIDSEKKFIHTKIDTWVNKLESSSLNKKEVKRKNHELIDIAKFISCFDKSINIIDALGECPDIIINCNNKIIGVELTDLISQTESKKKEGILLKIFNRIESELLKESNSYNGIYRVEFINENDICTKNEKKIRDEILQIIKGNLNSNSFISEVRPSYHTNIHLYASLGSSVGPLKRETLQANIDKKDIKHNNYSNKSLDEIWLLLVIGGVKQSDDYSVIEDDVLNVPYISKYKRIFILDFFKSSVFELPIYNNAG